MKAIALLILMAGLALGGYALSMDVTVTAPKISLGDGYAVPEMTVSNVGLIAKQQSYMTFSGILSVVGAILLGFSTMGPKASTPALQAEEVPAPEITVEKPTPTSTAISICPKCRSMGSGDAKICPRCEAPLEA